MPIGLVICALSVPSRSPSMLAEDTLAALTSALDPDTQPVCVALIGIDRFKAYNDRSDHPAGEDFLRTVATAWRRKLRTEDVIARVVGEKFAVLLSECDEESGLVVAERLRRAVPAGETASIGLAQWDGAEDATSLVGRADAALYRAREAGGDRFAAPPAAPQAAAS